MASSPRSQLRQLALDVDTLVVSVGEKLRDDGACGTLALLVKSVRAILCRGIVAQGDYDNPSRKLTDRQRVKQKGELLYSYLNRMLVDIKALDLLQDFQQVTNWLKFRSVFIKLNLYVFLVSVQSGAQVDGFYSLWLMF